MYYKDANRISFNLDETYHGDKNAMFQDIAKVLRILLDNEEICTVEYEDVGYYIIQHNYANLEYGDVYPMWLTADEQELIEKHRTENSTFEKQEENTNNYE